MSKILFCFRQGMNQVILWTIDWIVLPALIGVVYGFLGLAWRLGVDQHPLLHDAKKRFQRLLEEL
ncbi:hypothetical protein LCGC14_1098970 [marine sediment metagenome]|uniref:Uncharacterized protein n=1 Tax=marine sediment metagenome TaxID=412755 RepID=A0A0F9MEL6_9ZZZZ